MECVDDLQSDSADRPILRASSSPPKRISFNRDQPLHAAIQRGELLRKKKRLSIQTANTPLHVRNDEDCSTKRYRDNNRFYPRKPIWSQQAACNSKTCFTFKRGGSSSHVKRATSPSFATRPICSKANTNVSLRNRRPLNCPLRIAELATPTKRHCIDTWRDRHAMLPSHMLERLKQNVMNQKVVATIPDAVNCFKVHRNDRATNAPSHKSQCRIPKKSKESQEMADVRLMSAVLAHRIAAELIKPMNLYLPEELLKLANTVSEEIKEVIQNRRICADYVYDQGLLNEMSGKITLWISDVLACAQYKLLEDELRVVKTKENKISKEGNLVTLIGQYIRWQMEDDQDLEEEEGPALDALDALIDNVLDICLPKSDSSSYDDPSAQNDQKILLEIGDERKAQNEDLREDHNIQLSRKNITIDMNETETSNNIPGVNGVYDMPEHLNKDNSDDESESKYDSTVEVESNASVAGSQLEGNIKVSDVNATLEEPLDDRKKVKFTQNGRSTETGGSRETGGNGESGGNGKSGGYGANNRRAGRAISNESLGKWPNYSHSATFIRSDIVFQPPNPSILSVVDESWPDDNIPTLKTSASVSKSITSLGEIKEVDDETDILDYRHKRNNKTLKEDIHHHVPYTKYAKDNMERMGTFESFEQDDENSFMDYNYNDKHIKRLSALEFFEQDGKSAATTSSGTSSKIQKDKEDSYTSDSQRTHNKEPNLLFQVTPSKLLSDLQALILEQAEQIKSKLIKQEDYIVEAESFNDGKGDYNDTKNANKDDDTTDTEKNPIVQAIKEKLRKETKFDYRVRPQTAPAWVLTSPSEDSLPVTRKKMRLGTNELRKWCKDLENILINLEQWSKWMDVTCKKVLYMQQETAASKKLGPHYRIRLLKEWCNIKKIIDRDAMLWRKLNQRTYKALKTYPSKTQDTSRCTSTTQKKKNVGKDSVCKAIFDIEGMSAWLHRSIVSTEHVVRCNCRTLAKPQSCQNTKKLPKN